MVRLHVKAPEGNASAVDAAAVFHVLLTLSSTALKHLGRAALLACAPHSPPSSRVPHPATPPLLTLSIAERLLAARERGATEHELSLDLDRSRCTAQLGALRWSLSGRDFPYPQGLRERTVYRFDGQDWVAVSRYSGALIKLVPTDWGPPTFEIDGIKMLPTAKVSRWDDARAKVELIAPRGKAVLDCCGGLGYYAAWCLELGAARVRSFEKNPDVIWLRGLNPWSPDPADPAYAGRFEFGQGRIDAAIAELPDASFDAVLHDPPRFGIAGELYSLAFYQQLARVLKPGGRLFHYTGSPNRLTSGRDVPAEVIKRLQLAGFRAERALDGVLAVRASAPPRGR